MATPESKLSPIDVGEAAKKLSASISEPLEQLYKVGGYVLVFTFVGLILMLIGYFTEEKIFSRYLFWIGATIEIICFVGIFVAKGYAQKKTNALLSENQELIKTVLELANKLTENLFNLQSLLYKNAEFVAFLLEQTEPLLSQIPVLKGIDFSQSKNVNTAIFNTADTIREVVEDTRLAITEAKVEPLKKYVNKLEGLKENLREALKSEKSNAGNLNYKETIKSYQTAIIEYSSVVETITNDALIYINDVDKLLALAKLVPGIGERLKFIQQKSSNIKVIAVELNETSKNLTTSLENGDMNQIKQILDSFKGLSKSVKALQSSQSQLSE